MLLLLELSPTEIKLPKVLSFVMHPQSLSSQIEPASRHFQVVIPHEMVARMRDCLLNRGARAAHVGIVSVRSIRVTIRIAQPNRAQTRTYNL